MRIAIYLLMIGLLAGNAGADTVRIGLFRKEPPREIQVQGPCRMEKGGRTIPIESGKSAIIRASGQRAVLKPSNEGRVVTFLVEGLQKAYKGEVSVTPVHGSLLIVNRLDLDDYIRGVLPCEMPHDWPIQALAAQAVVARSFASANIGLHAKEGFDLCDLTHCQVYRGASWVRPETDRAVEMTADEVLTIQGKCVPTPYHSTCGGKSSTKYGVQSTKVPEYLSSVVDAEKGEAFCAGSPHYRWTVTLSSGDVEKALESDGHPVSGPITKISIVSRDDSGRALGIEVQGKRTVAVSGEEFMLMCGRHLGWNRIKSTLFEVKKTGGKFVFTGKGLGHGMGLCQWGARGMAERGSSYREILKHYFPKCSVTRR